MCLWGTHRLQGGSQRSGSALRPALNSTQGCARQQQGMYHNCLAAAKRLHNVVKELRGQKFYFFKVWSRDSNGILAERILMPAFLTGSPSVIVFLLVSAAQPFQPGLLRLMVEDGVLVLKTSYSIIVELLAAGPDQIALVPLEASRQALKQPGQSWHILQQQSDAASAHVFACVYFLKST